MRCKGEMIFGCRRPKMAQVITPTTRFLLFLVSLLFLFFNYFHFLTPAKNDANDK